MILAAEPDIEVVGEAAPAPRPSDHRELAPDVVLMDIRMPDLDGIKPPPDPRRQQAADQVLILTTFDLDEYVYDALRAGASGFLLKDVPAEQLATSVRAIGAGDALLAPSITRRLIEQFTTPRPAANAAPGIDELTPRELEVFGLLATGMTNTEIAAQLIVGETTIKTHVTHILMKLGGVTAFQAVVLAYEAGIVTPAAPHRHSASKPASG